MFRLIISAGLLCMRMPSHHAVSKNRIKGLSCFKSEISSSTPPHLIVFILIVTYVKPINTGKLAIDVGITKCLMMYSRGMHHMSYSRWDLELI